MKKILTIVFACMALAVGAVAMPEPAGQRIENVGNTATVRGGDGRITLVAGTAEASFTIYSITGQVVRTVTVSPEATVTVELPKGFYIVKYNHGQWSRKVVVK